jgi:outer membrane murein-binding lipoprotein Lpp
MRTTTLIGFAAAFATQAFAACSSALKVDDFSKWSSNTNSLNEYSSGLYTKNASSIA